MKKFVLVYWGKKGTHKPEDPQAEMKAWSDWMQELKTTGNLIEGEQGHPFSKSKLLRENDLRDGGVSSNDGLVVFGYTPILASDFEQAVKLAKSCPASKFCSIEIHETMQMP